MGDVTVGFIGTGTMGAPMAAQVLASGRTLRVHDTSPAATRSLVDAGATTHATAAETASGTSIVLLSLPGPNQVIEAVTAGPVCSPASHSRS